ncbi:MAG: biotin transporter BioY [Chloroflexi bacterium]|nr:biotin transporter BioY [Chloroflexota bacterium]
MRLTAKGATLADVLVAPLSMPWVLRDAVLVVGFTFFTAVFAQIAVNLPFTTVPITGQTFAVLLTGGALGSRRGAASMVLYILWALIGIPVFAPLPSTIGDVTVHFILPWKGTAGPIWNLTSGGYILGFILATYVIGRLAERGWDRGWRVNLAMLLGNLVIYLPGLAWLGYVIASHRLDAQLGFPVGNYQGLYDFIPGRHAVDKALVGGLYPYLMGDMIKLYLASLTLPGAWALVQRWRRK